MNILRAFLNTQRGKGPLIYRNIRVNSDQLPYLAKRLGKSFDFVLNTNVVVTSYSNWIDSVARVIDNRLGFIFSRDVISGWIKQGFLEGESADFLNEKICHINYGQDGYKCYNQQNGYTYSEKEYNTLSED